MGIFVLYWQNGEILITSEDIHQIETLTLRLSQKIKDEEFRITRGSEFNATYKGGRLLYAVGKKVA